MPLRRALLGLALPLMPLLAGCAQTIAPEVQVPMGPAPEVEDLEGFEAVYNDLALLDEGHPDRAIYRRALLEFLVGYVDERLSEGDTEEAVSALRYATSLYTPRELERVPPDPPLAGAARAVYKAVARRGAEEPALLALAIEQRFAAASRRQAVLEDWALLERWMVDNGPYASDPLMRHEELEGALEQVSAAFPSPFVTKRLADLYVARYRLAEQVGDESGESDSTAQRRMEITGYLLLRAYLRADDLRGAVQAAKRVELDPPVAKLAEMVEEAGEARRSPRPILALAEQFVPDPEANPAQPYVVQGWGIADNLARRAVREFPKDPYAHLLRANTLRNDGLTAAAIAHLRRALSLKEDMFEAWQTLARLEHEHLQALAEHDPALARERLPEVEELHARATELWSDRPIEPGLPDAFYVVAEGLYQAGEVQQAKALLERSLAIEPVPSSIDLLGTIALKSADLALARERYEDLATLAYESDLAQLQWEARARFQLAEVAAQEKDAAAATQHLRMALRHTNDLLARSNGAPGSRSDRHVERGKLLFLLGDFDLAMDDFRRASELDPSSVKAYADPLRYVVAHGYYPEARTIFRRAMEEQGLSETLKLYFSLWMRDLAQRQGVPADDRAEAFLAAYQGTTWGEALAKHARGELSFDALLETAEDRGERAEAYFYEGLRRWNAGDQAGGKELMRRVLQTGMMGFLEYDMALSYLTWGELPRTARLPISATTAKANP